MIILVVYYYYYYYHLYQTQTIQIMYGVSSFKIETTVSLQMEQCLNKQFDIYWKWKNYYFYASSLHIQSIVMAKNDGIKSTKKS